MGSSALPEPQDDPFKINSKVDFFTKIFASYLINQDRQSHEKEADLYGMRSLANRKYSVDAFSNFFLRTEDKKSSIMKKIDSWLSILYTHPSNKERVRSILLNTKKMKAKNYGTSVDIDERFQEIQKEVKKPV